MQQHLLSFLVDNLLLFAFNYALFYIALVVVRVADQKVTFIFSFPKKVFWFDTWHQFDQFSHQLATQQFNLSAHVFNQRRSTYAAAFQFKCGTYGCHARRFS